MAAETRTLYETPDGVIAEGGFGRAEIIVRAATTPGQMFIKTSTVKPDGRTFFQFIETDPEFARLFAAKILRVADAVEAGE